MREIDGTDGERNVRAKDIEIKRETKEDCGGKRQGKRRGRVKWVHLRSVKQNGLRIEPGSGPA